MGADARELDAEKPSAQAKTAQVGGHGVVLVPHRETGAGEDVLPPDYQRLMKIVRNAGGPVRVKDVGVELGLEVEVKGRLEPLRAKLSKLAGRGWRRRSTERTLTTIPRHWRAALARVLIARMTSLLASA
ncbi:hypothetical protein [Streptomyces iranensis]|uniref:hypothetical protein n=1 Tax=Streptomyces iranensis TaxID=576784 RepID=UPI0039B76C6F